MAIEYSRGSFANVSVNPAHFACVGKNIEVRCGDETGTGPILDLSTLRLCGLDLKLLFQGLKRPLINFAYLTRLKFESCPNVVAALDLLRTSQLSTPNPNRLKLQSFVLRCEIILPPFRAALEAFLCSLDGLWELQVLLEGSHTAQDLAPILRVHGKSLRILVWDERTGPRTSTRQSTTSVIGTCHLKTISTFCRELTSLGIPLNWQGFISKNRHYANVSFCDPTLAYTCLISFSSQNTC